MAIATFRNVGLCRARDAAVGMPTSRRRLPWTTPKRRRRTVTPRPCMVVSIASSHDAACEFERSGSVVPLATRSKLMTTTSNLRGRVLSGMRPTGKLHLGNYVGALANWVRMQDEYLFFFEVADLHQLP